MDFKGMFFCGFCPTPDPPNCGIFHIFLALPLFTSGWSKEIDHLNNSDQSAGIIIIVLLDFALSSRSC